jgi:DNA-binding transcriptional regulator YhcF (GntR family)
MRSYEKLTMDGIIFNQRGIGYFVAEGAKAIALDKMRTDFIENEVPLIKRKMELLQLKASDLGL